MSKELNIIEVLNSNVGTEYKAIAPEGHKYNCVVLLDEGNKVLINSKNGTKIDFLNDFIINTTFIQVQNPVSFIEAVKAYSYGKTIRCCYKEFNGEETTNIYKDGDIDAIIEDTCNFGISPREILNGKWYIEEELENEK